MSSEPVYELPHPATGCRTAWATATLDSRNNSLRQREREREKLDCTALYTVRAPGSNERNETRRVISPTVTPLTRVDKSRPSFCITPPVRSAPLIHSSRIVSCRFSLFSSSNY